MCIAQNNADSGNLGTKSVFVKQSRNRFGNCCAQCRSCSAMPEHFNLHCQGLWTRAAARISGRNRDQTTHSSQKQLTILLSIRRNLIRGYKKNNKSGTCRHDVHFSGSKNVPKSGTFRKTLPRLPKPQSETEKCDDCHTNFSRPCE